MADSEGESGGGLIATIFSSLGELLKELFGVLFSIIPKILKFVLWVVLALVVLPCVWVAGTVYPWWVEWGEEF